ncbi:MAG: GNAT family N-acetyltransferase [Bacteroidetes bacterium]|nr:GNAT family N-acetyltransferase [Bacteroidota bacterium]
MNFTLRPWTVKDLESLVKYGNNNNIAKFMTDKFPHPYTLEKGKQFIEFATSHKPVRLFAVEINGEACGGIGIHPQDDIHCKNAELGYWLGEPFWGQGIISKAIIQMVDHGFMNFDITRIFARPFGTNAASQKVLEKAGFKLEARFEKTLYKNGIYLDELIYSVNKKN